MKKTILLVLCLMLTMVINAGDVTPEQAMQQAQSFLQQRVTSGKNRSQKASELKMAGRISGLYVFNTDGDNGYVIVSNDDRTESVLAYSNSGRLNVDNMPENMRAWLQGYADEIAWLDAHGWQPEASAVPRRASAVKPSIAPLMLTHWDQDAPYNNLCPYYNVNSYNTTGGDGYKHCATGCVATAMAQAMYHNQWPVAATEAIPAYEWSGAGITLDGLPATTFDWDNMQLSYSGSETDEQNTAVATLMRYCGQSLRMNYGPSSSASTSDIADRLKTYFNYASTAQYLQRNRYTYTNWIDLIYHELAENRVVVYRGGSSGGGHSFICDGYDGEDYFHFNWGWGGTSDGYYQLSVVNPYDQGIGGSSTKDGFWMGQGAVVGIQKDGGTGTVLDVAPGDFNMSATVDAISDSPTQYQNVDVTVTVSNAGSDPYYGEIGLCVYYYNGGTWKTESYLYKHLPVPAGGDASATFTFVPKHAGYYYVRPFQNYGNLPVLGSGTSFTVAAGEPGTPTTDNITLTSELSVDNSYTEGSDKVFYVSACNATFKATITVTNPDPTNAYQGYYEWLLYNYESGAMITYSANEYTIAPNGKIAIPVQVTGLTAGDKYRLKVVYIKDGNWTSWANFDPYQAKAGLVSYDANGTQTVIKPNMLPTYLVPASAVAVDLSGTGVKTVIMNRNPNCLYILKSTDFVPVTISRSNVVLTDGSACTAADIKLTDGYDFYSPVDFTATNIEFTYANDRWADGTNGWNTIMLPFDVTSVTADDTAIDWFHHSTDYGKNFWLKEFVSDDTTAPKVYFDYASAMKANTPYIIALPGNHWGAENDLSGKTIKFIGSGSVKKSKQAVVTGNNYRFVGDTRAVTTENIYCINAAGNKFELKATGGSPAFRPFFKADIFDQSVDALGFGGGGGGTTEINEVRGTMEEVRGDFYDLSGRRLDQQPTQKGLYIHGGRKVVIK